MTQNLAAASGTFPLGGDLPVVRLGYGTMQLPGEGVWGPPRDKEAALAVLRRAVEIGITFFDTADSYGPEVAEDLLSSHCVASESSASTSSSCTASTARCRSRTRSAS
jgi:pyridoxine 4-dehydrogenase